MGILFAVLSAIFYSSSNTLVKYGMRSSAKNDNGVFMTMFINIVILSIALILFRSFSTDAPSPNLEGILLFAVAGFLTTLCGRSFLFAGIKRIGPSRAAAIKNAQPVFTLLFGLIVLGELISAGAWLGILFIFCGLFLQGFHLFRKGSGNSHLDYIGFLFTFTAALGFGIGQGVRKQAILVFDDPFSGALIGTVIAFVSFSVIELFKGQYFEQVKSNLTFKNPYYIGAGIGTSFALLSFFMAISYIQVVYVAAIVACEPILTLILSRIILKNEEQLSVYTIISAIAIFVGAVFIAIRG